MACSLFYYVVIKFNLLYISVVCVLWRCVQDNSMTAPSTKIIFVLMTID